MAIGYLVAVSGAANDAQPVSDPQQQCIQQHGGKDWFPSTDGCNSCACDKNGLVLCTLRACVTTNDTQVSPDLRQQCIQQHGGKDWFPSTDGCNMCGCDKNGTVSCTMKACLGAADSGASTALQVQSAVALIVPAALFLWQC